MGLLLLQRGKRGRSLEAMGEQDRSGGRIGHIHTTHKGLSCSKDSGVDQMRGGGWMTVHQPPLFSVVSP